MFTRAEDLAVLRQQLATATAEANRLDTEASAALQARDIPTFRRLVAQAAAAWATKRQLASLVRAGGQPATGQVEETIGGFAWSRRP